MKPQQCLFHSCLEFSKGYHYTASIEQVVLSRGYKNQISFKNTSINKKALVSWMHMESLPFPDQRVNAVEYLHNYLKVSCLNNSSALSMYLSGHIRYYWAGVTKVKLASIKNPHCCKVNPAKYLKHYSKFSYLGNYYALGMHLSA